MLKQPYKSSFEKIIDLKARVGFEIGITNWFSFSQEQINTFGVLTGDNQWIHVNSEKAKKESPYGTPIVHGFFVLSMLSKMVMEAYKVKDVVMGVNYGLNKVRFINAVKVDAKIRGIITLLDYKTIKNGARLTMEITMEIEGEAKPACVAEWIGQFYVEK